MYKFLSIEFNLYYEISKLIYYQSKQLLLSIEYIDDKRLK